ncbi:MAG: sugar phosphate nucleotidyltransferase, partial [Oscillospiraceae bacterium]|nr:sugar phosphate nucleotidyltransferase [Oscillospiraceae bacterium]
TIVDTGLDTTTGGRLLAVRDYIGDERFFLTYGDGVSNVDINAVLDFHKKKNKLATITVVREYQRYGAVKLDKEGNLTLFREKSSQDSRHINGGFMVIEPEIFPYLQAEFPLEERPIEQLTTEGQVAGYWHDGFWQCMDTLRDKLSLEELWKSGEAPWKVW